MGEVDQEEDVPSMWHVWPCHIVKVEEEADEFSTDVEVNGGLVTQSQLVIEQKCSTPRCA